VSIAKPAQRHKYSTRTVQIQKTKTLNGQNKNNVVGNTNNNNNKQTIIRDNEKGTCMLIDVTISEDRNVIKKEAEKILKYKDLTI
jgi:hypothetical protein